MSAVRSLGEITGRLTTRIRNRDCLALNSSCAIRPRAHSTLPNSQSDVLRIQKSNVYRFGDANRATPVFRDLEWTIKINESWAVLSSGSGEKSSLFDMLMGHLRIHPSPPPPEGLFPFLVDAKTSRDPHECVSLVSFTNRRAAGGAFYDYTARYGAVREEDRITLRQSMFPETIKDLKSASRIALDAPATDHKLFEHLVQKMGLADLLDLPRIALSNGQTRRARILKALLTKPCLLLLDEPLTGLDAENRVTVLEILHELHRACDPHIILGLRMQDPVPEWITHIAIVRNGQVVAGPNDRMLQLRARINDSSGTPVDQGVILPTSGSAPLPPVVEMNNVTVAYGPRTVLKNITLNLRPGKRYHLQGANGSGKTTLLALLTGDHPQSYTQLGPSRSLRLFGVPRQRLATPALHARVGVVTPELFDAFPRRAPGMSVWETLGTGFDGGFVPKGARDVGVGVGRAAELSTQEREWRVARCWEVLATLGPRAWRAQSTHAHADTDAAADSGRDVDEAFAQRKFMDLPVGEQRVVLLMRALVGRHPLVLLDEVWSGMDAGMVQAAHTYLRSGGVGADQAVVVVMHLAEEVPWGARDGVVRVLLRDGEIQPSEDLA
ncbi:P-loop containing nucleoside triphosphate hydrolase protein [Mycena rebaudengoi]|nr:P-loop containing nucleoside triphosphate hydrolase protein [Mycena rebaudengoi]